ncbi:MAG TPA: hypothetical protein ACFYD6_07470 [Candidatus Brocadiia bacterium]|nr:hypothetical protein [Candidatus Brocadiales bacterium]
MKIESRLNNIFDQYDIEENRATNAFFQVLRQDAHLLKTFINKYFKIRTGKNTNVIISSQKKPFALGDAKKDREKTESIPDGLVIIDEDKAIVFESKIAKNAIKRDQLLAHIKRIKGYPQKHLCVITPDEESPVKDFNVSNIDIRWISWREIYDFVTNEKEIQGGSWYLRNQLKEYLAMKEDLVGFQGVDYPSGTYNHEEAKNIIKNLIKEIKPDILKIFPELKHEREIYTQAVHPYTTFHRSTWSFLGAYKKFTKDIYLTFWLTETHMGMGITIPNYAGNNRWKRLKEIFEGDDIFASFVKKLFKLRKNLPNLFIEFVQRHFLGRSKPIIDGIIEMNLDTVEGRKEVEVKENKKWLEVLRELVKNKEGYNGELALYTRFFYKDCPKRKTAAFKNVVINTAGDFKEIYKFLQKN